MQTTTFKDRFQNHPQGRALLEVMTACQPGVLGVSGGVDSSLLAATAAMWGLSYRAVFLGGPHLSPAEREEAARFVRSLDLPSGLGTFSPLDVAPAAANGPDRCYHCKTALILALRTQLDAPQGSVIDGSHLSDQGEYRPGRRAMQEQGVHSPLAEAGWTKDDVRAWARSMGLPQADQPSRPCLMTRFAYGYAMTEEELLQAGRAEDALRRAGLSLFRIRILADRRVILHIHNSEEDLARNLHKDIQTRMHRHGFSSFSLQPIQTLSGYFDRTTHMHTFSPHAGRS